MINHIILYGSLWGIFEATFGFLLHLQPFNIGWIFWSPVAFFLMHRAYIKTGKPCSILYVSLFAGLTKLINLPISPRLDKVINPAMSIILEGIAMFIAVLVFEKKYKLLKPIIYNMGWRSLYILYISLTPWLNKSSSLLSDSSEIFSHLITKNIITTIAIFLIIHFENKLPKKTFKPLLNKVALTLLFILNIFLELKL